MSSINPVFVLPGALAENGADLGKAFIASMNVGVGQLCTSPGLVFIIDGPGADDFIAAASESVQSTATAPMLYPGIASAFTAGAQKLSNADGVEVAARGAETPGLSCPGRPALFVTTAAEFLRHPELNDEVFGPASLIVKVADVADLAAIVDRLEGQLSATVHATPVDYPVARALVDKLEILAGRVVFNGWPTGVEVGHAIVHGGPFPATSAPSTTSVGSRAIERFLRPVAYQNVPDELLAPEVRADNPLHIWRRIDGELRRD